jgi:large subunit ribosomal protein L30
MGTITVKQVRSKNGRRERQRRTLRALGLRGIRDTVTHEDTPQIRGMIEKVRHLVEVEATDE